MAPYCSFGEKKEKKIEKAPERSSLSQIIEEAMRPEANISSTLNSRSKKPTAPKNSKQESMVGGTLDFEPRTASELMLASLRNTASMEQLFPPPSPPSTLANLNYQLASVIVHHGTHKSGHYTVFKRHREDFGMEPGYTSKTNPTKQEAGNDSWWYISDNNVSKVDVHKVLKARAYMLYYEKIS